MSEIQPITPFHAAFAVTNLDGLAEWYAENLGCEYSSRSDHSVDINFFGHQLVLHLQKNAPPYVLNLPHFGAILSVRDWEQLKNRLVKKSVKFDVGPKIEYEGTPKEKFTMFLKDPAGITLEFKAHKREEAWKDRLARIRV